MLEDDIIINPHSDCKSIFVKYLDDQQVNFTEPVSLAAIKRSLSGSDKNERKPWSVSTLDTFKSLSQDTCKCPRDTMDDMQMFLLVVVAILLILVVIMLIGYMLESLHKTFGFELKWIFRKNSRSASSCRAVHYHMNDNNDGRADRRPAAGVQKQGEPNDEGERE